MDGGVELCALVELLAHESARCQAVSERVFAELAFGNPAVMCSLGYVEPVFARQVDLLCCAHALNPIK
jgi:hypothetical protein